ncbi:cytochrome P460 family protein [Methylomicrobium sp. Wu6]|uniref:cytochrome P460 family protein n=1 Tax=Methylomicrobium sp. Wu6 TaxID=3107928 RepID=UPI002DD69B03|nr:cytochrome P460 family protein [Methylomicrobium sp. Wu6]MEC4750261.1 cytochrome P460 family protein [Methylomicrobium sp. Wu6]
MKLISTLTFGGVLLAAGAVLAAEKPAPAPNGIELPAYYKNWRVIGVSHRQDKESLRVIVGNDTAVNAARAGNTNPWPEGSILGKLAWKDQIHPKWAAATVPGEFVHAEFMIKDSAKFAKTGGWGFARWLGMEQKPYGTDASFVQECLACHDQVKGNDSVFTHPVPLP